jgi:hypothetical protein
MRLFVSGEGWLGWRCVVVSGLVLVRGHGGRDGSDWAPVVCSGEE